MTAPTRDPAPTQPYPGATFLDMQNDVLALAGFTATDAPTAVLTKVKRFINEGVSRLMRAFPNLCHTERYTALALIADQKTYQLPRGVIKIVDPIRIIENPTDATEPDEGTPCYALPQEYRNRLPAAETFGETYYMVWGTDVATATTEQVGVIEFRPAPAAAGKAHLYYRGLATALSADTDLVRVPPGFESLVVSFAEWRFLRTLGELKQSKDSLEAWRMGLGDLAILDAQRRSEGEFAQIPAYMYSRRRFNGFSNSPVEGQS